MMIGSCSGCKTQHESVVIGRNWMAQKVFTNQIESFVVIESVDALVHLKHSSAKKELNFQKRDTKTSDEQGTVKANTSEAEIYLDIFTRIAICDVIKQTVKRKREKIKQTP